MPLSEREKELRRLRYRLYKHGLTPRQVRAGSKYYRKFCKPLDIPMGKCILMVVRMVENMRKAYVKAAGKPLKKVGET